MQKHLYFICPTDHLETIINKKFDYENYFCNSLGNSVTFDDDLVGHINDLIESKNIRNITFVLANNNPIVVDAIQDHELPHLRGLNHFYNNISKQKRRSKKLWQMNDLRIPILSYYLNMKIQELQPRISAWVADEINISGLIYCAERNTFKELCGEFFAEKHFSLN